MTKKNKYIFAVVYMAYTAIYLARINLSVASPGLKESGVLDTVQIGILGSAFSAIYACGRLINGNLSDKKPPWLMLSVGLFIAGISNIAIGFLPPFAAFFVLWSANAYAQSMLWGSVLCTVSSIYDAKTAKKKMSVMITSVAMGNVLAIVINSWLIKMLDERLAFIVPGAITIVLGAAIIFLVHDVENKSEKKHTSFKDVLKDKQLLVMTVPAAFHGIMKENISLWMAVYVMDSYKVDFTTTSYYILLIPIIGFLGRNIYPFLYKACKENENIVSVIGFIVCAAASMILIFGNTSMSVAVILLSLIYAAVSVINTSFLSIYPLEFAVAGNSASVSGVMDFATYLGAGVSSFAYGIAVKNFGYMPMFLSWAVVSAISIYILIKRRENK